MCDKVCELHFPQLRKLLLISQAVKMNGNKEFQLQNTTELMTIFFLARKVRWKLLRIKIKAQNGLPMPKSLLASLSTTSTLLFFLHFLRGAMLLSYHTVFTHAVPCLARE